jgi:hypothetical protein
MVGVSSEVETARALQLEHRADRTMLYTAGSALCSAGCGSVGTRSSVEGGVGWP